MDRLFEAIAVWLTRRDRSGGKESNFYVSSSWRILARVLLVLDSQIPSDDRTNLKDVYSIDT